MMSDDASKPVEYNSDDPVWTRTRLYHRKLLSLCAESNTRAIWDCAQCVLDKIWDAGVDKKSSSSDESNRIVYGCQTCGHLLHPGWQGSSLTVERIAATKSKTLKRRQQRKRRKQGLSNLRDAKDVNRPKHQKPAQASSVQECRVVLLQNDPNLILDRHHLALRCGRCQSKVRLKGLKPEKPVSKKSLHPVDATKKRKMEQTTESTRGNREGADFMQLPSSASQSANMPLSTPGRKKKKKKPGPKNNKLMNFLSSLND